MIYEKLNLIGLSIFLVLLSTNYLEKLIKQCYIPLRKLNPPGTTKTKKWFSLVRQ